MTPTFFSRYRYRSKGEGSWFGGFLLERGRASRLPVSARCVLPTT
jgi:hypothetical protein